MKLALNKIVGRPILHPVAGVVTGYEFVEAMRKLASDPIPVKERYALARSLEDVAHWVKIYEDKKNELLLKHCEPKMEFLLRKLNELQGKLAGEGEVKTPGLVERANRFAQAIEELNAAGTDGGFVFRSEEDGKALAAALKALEKEEAEFFLDHQVALAAESKLTGNEIALLIDLVAAPAE